MKTKMKTKMKTFLLILSLSLMAISAHAASCDSDGNIAQIKSTVQSLGKFEMSELKDTPVGTRVIFKEDLTLTPDAEMTFFKGSKRCGIFHERASEHLDNDRNKGGIESANAYRVLKTVSKKEGQYITVYIDETDSKGIAKAQDYSVIFCAASPDGSSMSVNDLYVDSGVRFQKLLKLEPKPIK
jgi:hypothetical protein